MANPRQRRKSRSSSYRPVSHSKRAKRNIKKCPPIRGPKALQDAWDKHMTVKQNYAALGLIHSLNPLGSGGTENPSGMEKESLPVEPTPSTSKLPDGFGKIIRDEAGNVVRIELNEDDQPPPPKEDVGMDELEAMIEPEVLSKWAIGGVQCQEESSVVEALGQISAPRTASHTLSFALSGVGSRHASVGEISYLRKLVNKYGEDVEGMTKDRRLNTEQRTAGDLRRALRRAGFGVGNSD